MSSDDSTNAPSADGSASGEVTPTGSMQTPAGAAQGRREAVREKAQQVQVQQSRARMVRRAAWISGAVVAVAVVAVVVGMTVGGAANKPQLSPDRADQDGFVVTSISSSTGMTSPDDASTPTAGGEATPTPSPTASAAAPVQIHVYVDYLSPSAREWQLANEPQLSTWVAEGAATLTYHPVAMLTAKSNGTKYSLRAASAAACVATYAPASFFQFNSDLLKRQPAVDSDGFSDKDLADIASANGTGDQPKKLRECIETEMYAGWAKAATERAVAGIDGTDGLALTGNAMVMVNGQAYQGEMTDPAEFSQFVLTSASGKGAKNATQTPSPTPSVTP